MPPTTSKPAVKKAAATKTPVVRQLRPKPQPEPEPVPQPIGFTAPAAALTAVLEKVGKFTPSTGGVLPVLATVCVDVAADRATFTGTDLEHTAVMSLPVTPTAAGRFLIPPKAHAVIRTLSGDVELGWDDENGVVVVKTADYTGRFRAAPISDFPAMYPVEGERVTVDAIELRGAIKRTALVACSADQARSVLTGVLVDSQEGRLLMVATDSYRLSVAATAIPFDRPKPVLIPGRSLALLNRTLDPADSEVTVTIGERQIEFATSNVTVTTRLIEGEYPNWRNLVPSSHAFHTKFARDAMIKAAKRGLALANTASSPLRLAISAKSIQPSVNVMDVGDGIEAIAATTESGGEVGFGRQTVTIAYNPNYLLDGLEMHEGAELVLEVIDPMKPAVLRSEGAESYYLLMPVRV